MTQRTVVNDGNGLNQEPKEGCCERKTDIAKVPSRPPAIFGPASKAQAQRLQKLDVGSTIYLYTDEEHRQYSERDRADHLQNASTMQINYGSGGMA